jgi:hypothetical protein
MAREGRVFTDFYVTQPVCSASRAGLMTGCYNVRVSIHGALAHRSEYGLHADEMTLAEVVKQRDYATACYGKWHLGHHPGFLPTRHGFDEFFGIPYSNDMWPHHPTAKNVFPNLPLIEGTRVINADMKDEDQRQLTTQLTEHAVDFMERNKERPFLVYLPHPMVHVPLYVSDKFQGKSARGLFGDVVYAFIRTYKPVLDGEPFRAFETAADYRRWCEENVPDWLTGNWLTGTWKTVRHNWGVFGPIHARPVCACFRCKPITGGDA